VLAVVAVGGVLGALARDALERALPHQPGGFPWATFAVNVSGCLLIGVLMAGVEQLPVHRLARPFLGVGVLGGFTTFSTQVVEARQAAGSGAVALAIGYLAGTLLAALGAVWAGSTAALALLRAGRQRRGAR
jgi:CrcB protein